MLKIMISVKLEFDYLSSPENLIKLSKVLYLENEVRSKRV